MRIFAGVAAREWKFAAAGGRIVGKVRSRNCFAVKRKPYRALQRSQMVLEKYQPDQRNDRDPYDGIRRYEPVPESSVGRIRLLPQQTTVCVFSDHQRLPGRQFQGKRLVSCGPFNLAEPGDHRRTRGVSTSIAPSDYEP